MLAARHHDDDDDIGKKSNVSCIICKFYLFCLQVNVMFVFSR